MSIVIVIVVPPLFQLLRHLLLVRATVLLVLLCWGLWSSTSWPLRSPHKAWRHTLVEKTKARMASCCIHGPAESVVPDLNKRTKTTHDASSRIMLNISSTNALDKFGDLQNLIGGKNLVLFLDYDGTLTPIVSQPDQARISDENREIVQAVKDTFPTNIVSGRAVDKVSAFLNLEGLLFAGSHGFDIRGVSRGNDVKYEVAAEYLPGCGRCCATPLPLAGVAGAAVEDNVYSVTVHYRNCAREDVPELKSILDAEKAAYENIVITEGKMVYELRPNFVWHKGEAVRWILENQRFPGNEYFGIYIGDDKTDEDAFQTLREHPELGGLGILVSEEDQASHATFSLRNPDEVGQFLARLVAAEQQRRAPANGC
ncbi:unnamed protein product, partial [Heterosigma akashiwo]